MALTNNGMILRHNIIRLFDDLSDERIIYVTAPAGYGKTVAVRQWLDGNAPAKAVISLDEYDNNPVNFCERFCTALCACQPKNNALAEIVSHPAFDGAPDEFTLKAIAALSDKKRVVFVIDDLHFIHNEGVLGLLLIFLKRLPENCQIILISRNDLAPGFSDLWIRGHLAKITAEQLRFSDEEIMLLYKKRGAPVTPEQANGIYSVTNGWAIGINALLLSGGDSSGESLDYLDGFIRANVWERWDKATREFMLNTAAARELHPSLCAVLTGVADSEKILKELMRGGAFIFQSSNGIYHYHHLFQSFLRHILEERGDGYLFPLLEKEGEWYLTGQDFYSAADCFIRCGNYEGIAKCFDLLEVSDRNDFVIEMMLPIIKNPEIRAAADKFPFLFYMMAWAALAEGRTTDMTAYMDQYYTRFPEITARDPVHAHNIFYMRIFDFRIPFKQLINEVAALPNVPEVKGVQGSITMNMPMLHRSISDFSEFACEDTEAGIESLGGVVGWLFGEEWELIAESLTSGLLYEQGLLERAHIHALAANAAIKRHFAPELKFCAMSVLICVLDALGQPDEAKKVLSNLALAIEQDRAYYLNYNLNALTVRRKFQKGDMKAAGNWLIKHETDLHDNLTLRGTYETFTTCRAYITIGNYDSAIILSTKLLELAKAYNRPLDIIEAQILLAISYWKKKRGFQGEAIQHLEDAVSAAYGFGYMQLFANEGAELAGMLQRLQRRTEQRSDESMTPAGFIKTLYLCASEHQNAGLTSGQPNLPEKYTDKQKTVMKLLCEGKSYREITEIMGIKLPTLRSHIALIYKKLDVTNEKDAIMKIKKTGVLEEV